MSKRASASFQLKRPPKSERGRGGSGHSVRGGAFAPTARRSFSTARWGRVASAALAALASGCGTDARGVSECREIETARCEAAVACGFGNVEGCQRFYRDHCLHGTGLDDLLEVDVQNCVTSIRNAGRCAADLGADTSPAACSEPIASTAANVCELISSPERATACGFLTPTSSDAEGEGGS